MIKILFVCHGNICRSPMAEFILKDMVSRRGLSRQVQIDSRATSSEEIWHGTGNPVYPPRARELALHGIDCRGKTARQMTKADYDSYDFIIGMDSRNIQNILRICGVNSSDKIYRLSAFCGSEKDISDPWYTDDFATCYADIEKGCRALLGVIRDMI